MPDHTPEQIQATLALLDDTPEPYAPYDEPADPPAEENPIEILFENDRQLGEAIERLQEQPVDNSAPLKPKVARIDPDDRRVLYIVLTLVLVVAAAAGAASFAGQTAMGPYTGLPGWLYPVIPMFIDLPIMVVSFLIPIFRARGESVLTSWIMLGTLTALSSAINVVHVLTSQGVFDGGTLTVETLTGCVVMGLAPIVIMIAFEETVRLAVHTPEKE